VREANRRRRDAERAVREAEKSLREARRRERDEITAARQRAPEQDAKSAERCGEGSSSGPPGTPRDPDGSSPGRRVAAAVFSARRSWRGQRGRESRWCGDRAPSVGHRGSPDRRRLRLGVLDDEQAPGCSQSAAPSSRARAPRRARPRPP
jgi:hypothetical protein